MRRSSSAPSACHPHVWPLVTKAPGFPTGGWRNIDGGRGGTCAVLRGALPAAGAPWRFATSADLRSRPQTIDQCILLASAPILRFSLRFLSTFHLHTAFPPAIALITLFGHLRRGRHPGHTRLLLAGVRGAGQLQHTWNWPGLEGQGLQQNNFSSLYRDATMARLRSPALPLTPPFTPRAHLVGYLKMDATWSV